MKMKKLLNKQSLLLATIKSQSGVIHALPLLVIVAVVGIISYLLISSTAPFKEGLFGTLNPRPASNAAAPTYVYPVKMSANKRYLVDQNNVPFLIVGHSPQALVGDLSESDM